MPSLSDLTRLLRVEQWYKNLVLFLPWLMQEFGDNKNVYPVSLLFIGFLGFCAMSSLTYLINDWVDRKKDRTHPIKKTRPLASGRITGTQAMVVAAGLAVVAGVAAWQLGPLYRALLCIYFVATNAYSFGLKNIPVLDVVMIAMNFIFRLLGGLIDLPKKAAFPYLGIVFGVIVIFTTHKRWSDRTLMGEKASHHKPVLRFYNKTVCAALLALGYGVIAITSVLLVKEGRMENTEAGTLILWLGLTSGLFIKNPLLSLKPAGLLKNPLWCVIFGLFLLLLILD